MDEPQRFPLKPPVILTLLALVCFAGSALFFTHMAWTRHTDIYRLRDLPVSDDVKVRVLWVMAGLQLVLVGLAPVKVWAMLRPAVLEIGTDYVVLPYGLGLRRQVRLAAGEKLAVDEEEDGRWRVVRVRWPGGTGRLPELWFASPEDMDRALAVLRQFASGRGRAEAEAETEADHGSRGWSQAGR